MHSNGNSPIQEKDRSNERGVGVVEVVIVLVIILVLAAFAIPGGARQLRLHRLDSSVSVISNKIMEARMDAIKRNRTSLLRLDLTAGSAIVRSTDNAGTAINVGTAQLFSEGVVLTGSTVDISFDSLGRLTPGTQVTVTLQETISGMRKNITVTPAGRVVVGPMY